MCYDTCILNIRKIKSELNDSVCKFNTVQFHSKLHVFTLFNHFVSKSFSKLTEFVNLYIGLSCICKRNVYWGMNEIFPLGMKIAFERSVWKKLSEIKTGIFFIFFFRSYGVVTIVIESRYKEFAWKFTV